MNIYLFHKRLILSEESCAVVNLVGGPRTESKAEPEQSLKPDHLGSAGTRSLSPLLGGGREVGLGERGRGRLLGEQLGHHIFVSVGGQSAKMVQSTPGPG